MKKKTLWQRLDFDKVPTCEVCEKEPVFSFSFFPDPLEVERVKHLQKDNPTPGFEILTGEKLRQFIEGPKELAEARDLEAAPYTPKMTVP